MHTNGGQSVPKVKYGCPVEVTLDVIGGKWKCVILWWLRRDRKSFGELKQLIPSITSKVLTQQLRELEEDGLVYREAYREVPRRVEYFLTGDGKTLNPFLEWMCDWGKNRLSRFQFGLLNLIDLRVLIVSSYVDVCELLRSELGVRNAQVIVATSAIEAVTLFSQMQFTALVVDLEIPNGKGYALLREIRNLEVGQGHRVPAIGITVQANSPERRLALQAGFQVCLAKPIELAELATTLANLTGILGT